MLNKSGSQMIQVLIVLAAFTIIMTGAIFALQAAIQDVGEHTALSIQQDVVIR